MFVWDQQLGQSLLTIDIISGAVLSSATISGPTVKVLEYESSTGRLLSVIGDPGVCPTLVEVDPTTGNQTVIGCFPQITSTFVAVDSAIDVATNSLFFLHGSPQSLVVVDTVTGVMVSNAVVPWPVIINRMEFDSSTSQIYAFGGPVSANWLAGIMVLDPMTATVTPAPVAQAVIAGSIVLWHSAALDEQRRQFHMVGSRVPFTSWPPIDDRLITFDIDTGEILSDPLIPTNPYILFEVDTSWVPSMGRVTPSPNNLLVPGNTRTLTFESPFDAGDFYIPFVSCTPGAWPIPGSNLVMPLAFDACSDLYFFSPFSSQFFNLTPSGLADILPATGAQGTVTLPVLTPSGLNIDLHVSFITISTSIQWTGVHGAAILRIVT